MGNACAGQNRPDHRDLCSASSDKGSKAAGEPSCSTVPACRGNCIKQFNYNESEKSPHCPSRDLKVLISISGCAGLGIKQYARKNKKYLIGYLLCSKHVRLAESVQSAAQERSKDQVMRQ